MCEKWTFFVLLDLIILACSTPGRFYHDYHTSHDKNPWNGEWGESWQYDWWQTTKLTRRRTTTPSVEPQSTPAISTTTLPQPTIRDVDIRLGEIQTGNSPPNPKPITLIQELPTKDKPQTASNSSYSFDAFQSALDNSETKPSIQETSTSKGDKKPGSENNPNIFGSNEAHNPEKLVDQDSFPHEDTKTKPITNQDSVFEVAISTIEADTSGAKPEISPQYKPVSEDSDDNKKYLSSLEQALEAITGTGDGNENYEAPLLSEKASLWHVSIYEKKGRFEHICGGSLIKADLVLSAGHCFVSPVGQAPPSKFRVAAGKLYPRYDDPRDTAAQYSEIRNISTSDMVAPCYQPDMAYVYLVTPIRYTSSVRPVCFSLDAGLGNRQLREGNSGTVASWSSQDDGACSPLRHSWLSLPFVENSVCQYTVYYKTGGSDRICAGEINSTSECPTDSGNGLVFYRDKIPYLRGVVSTLPVHRDCARFYTRSFANVIDRRGILRKYLRGITEVYDLGQCEELYRNPSPDADQNTGSGLGDGFVQTDPPTEPDEQVFTAQGIGSKLVPALPGTSAPALQWHVGVYSKRWQPYLQLCGGSLVKRDSVISAAHCFWDDEAGMLPASQFAVAGGKLFRPWNDTQDTYAQYSDISEIIVPTRFRGGATSFQDDIAVLRLSTPFTYAPGVQSVCVDLRGQFEMRQLQPGNMGTIMGWGLTTENGLPSQVLTYLELPVVDVDDCFADSEPAFHKYITSDKVCAGDTTTGKALCRGDSGGGFVVYSSTTPYLHGVASTAAGNQNLCNAFALAALTSLYAHRAFLRQNIPDIDKECVTTGVEGITEREGTVTKGTEAPLYTNVPYFPYPNHFVCNCNCKP